MDGEKKFGLDHNERPMDCRRLLAIEKQWGIAMPLRWEAIWNSIFGLGVPAMQMNSAIREMCGSCESELLVCFWYQQTDQNSILGYLWVTLLTFSCTTKLWQSRELMSTMSCSIILTACFLRLLAICYVGHNPSFVWGGQISWCRNSVFMKNFAMMSLLKWSYASNNPLDSKWSYSPIDPLDYIPSLVDLSL